MRNRQVDGVEDIPHGSHQFSKRSEGKISYMGVKLVPGRLIHGIVKGLPCCEKRQKVRKARIVRRGKIQKSVVVQYTVNLGQEMLDTHQVLDGGQRDHGIEMAIREWVPGIGGVEIERHRLQSGLPHDFQAGRAYVVADQLRRVGCIPDVPADDPDPGGDIQYSPVMAIFKYPREYPVAFMEALVIFHCVYVVQSAFFQSNGVVSHMEERCRAAIFTPSQPLFRNGRGSDQL